MNPLRKKSISIILIITLLQLPVNYTFASNSTNNSVIEQNIISLSKVGQPIIELGQIDESSITDPNAYKLVSDNEFIDELIDSQNISHEIRFVNLTESADNIDNLKLSVYEYSQQSIVKDGYITFELYKDDGAGSLTYLGATEPINIIDYSGLDIYITFPKVEYQDQQYIYIRIGISTAVNPSAYTASTAFKVENTFSNQEYQPENGDYVIISNESVDSSSTQSTGTIPLSIANQKTNESLELEAYKMDYNPGFNPQENYAEISKSIESVEYSYQIGESKQFWVMDLSTSPQQDYQISATLSYSGTKANVWVNGNYIDSTDAATLGAEFDSKINSKITNSFGSNSDVDSDGRINILCYDIKDGFSGAGGYIAGYFHSRDLYNTAYSNNMEVFYIDTYPAIYTSGSKQVSDCYGTLAHEFQHMINYNQNVLIESGNNMDTWLNEALSESASQVYSGSVSQSRIDYYNSSANINNGVSLIQWTGSLDNYSLSYLFSQYLKKQVGIGDQVFKEINQSSYNDYRAIEQAIQKYISPGLTFGKFMTDFRTALVLKSPTGAYGFKGDIAFDVINTKLFNGSKTNLYGGGAVVKAIDSASDYVAPSDKGASVVYNAVVPLNKKYDIDKDSDVDIADLASLSSKYNYKSSNNSYSIDYDFNKDNIIDLFDFVALSRYIG